MVMAKVSVNLQIKDQQENGKDYVLDNDLTPGKWAMVLKTTFMITLNF